MPVRLSKYFQFRFFLIFCGLFYMMLCLLPFFLYGPHPLGYDTGFYRRFLINPDISTPNAPVPGLDHTIFTPRIFLDAVRFLGFSPDVSLYGSYIFLLLAFAGTFYYFLRAYVSKWIALFGLILLVLSPVQYMAYWFMFYKNFFGLIFFFLALTFLKKKYFFPSLLCALILPLSHQTTTIVLLGVLGVYIVITVLLEKKFLIPELIILILTLLVYLYLHPHVQQKIDAPPVGIFIEKINFLFMTLPLIALTLAGLPRFIKILKENIILAAFGVIGIISPLFSLPYYQRTFLFTHYWLIIGAAIGASAFFESHFFSKKLKFALLTVALVFQGTLLVYQIIELKPLVSPEIISQIELLQDNLQENASILTSTRFTPWVQGWTTAKVYAPGILKDKHTSSEWQEYFSSGDNEKLMFLESFPKPLYIFSDNGNSIFLPKASCVRKLNTMLYSVECQ